MFISAVTGQGLNQLKDILWQELNSESNKLKNILAEDTLVHRDKDISRFAFEQEVEGEDLDMVYLDESDVEDIDHFEYEENE